jgi:hypothetical protein
VTRRVCAVVAVLACFAGLGGFVASGAVASRAVATGPGPRHAATADLAGCVDRGDEGRTATRVRSRPVHARGHWRGTGHAVEAPAPGSTHTFDPTDHVTRACAPRAGTTRHHNTRAPPTKEGHP